jgi:hypothetical protein
VSATWPTTSIGTGRARGVDRLTGAAADEIDGDARLGQMRQDVVHEM